MTPIGWLVCLWGTGGVVVFLGSAVSRLIPIAAEALQSELTLLHWGSLVLSVVSLGYYEGYKAFQKKFSPRVVERAFELGQSPSWLNGVLAPAYCMNLYSASRKEVITSWGVLIGVTILVMILRVTPQPWRGIVDAGVVVGLSWGTIAIVVFFLLALRRR